MVSEKECDDRRHRMLRNWMLPLVGALAVTCGYMYLRLDSALRRVEMLTVDTRARVVNIERSVNRRSSGASVDRPTPWIALERLASEDGE